DRPRRTASPLTVAIGYHRTPRKEASMKLGVLLSVYAIVSAAAGVAGLVFADDLLRIYGIAAPGPVEVLLLRFIAAWSVGLAVMAWFARGADGSKARDGLVLGLVVLNAVSTVLAVLGATSGVYNGFGW